MQHAAVARCVPTNADVANPPDATALPALKPNHPNQSKAAPRRVIVKLCGGIGSLLRPLLLPTIIAAARAATPELICTTRPPAKSSATPVFR